MSNLVGSIVRGFGFTVGRISAERTISKLSDVQDSKVYDPFSLGLGQKVLVGILWLGLWINIWESIKGDPNPSTIQSLLLTFGVLLGWIPFRMFFRWYNRSRYEKMINNKQNLIIGRSKEVLKKIETEFPYVSINVNLDILDFTKLQNQLERIENVYFKLGKCRDNGFNFEDTEKVLSNEIWIGMSMEHLDMIKGVPTKIEKDVLKSGKEKIKYIYGSKNHGDVFVFENNQLVSYKDR